MDDDFETEMSDVRPDPPTRSPQAQPDRPPDPSTTSSTILEEASGNEITVERLHQEDAGAVHPLRRPRFSLPKGHARRLRGLLVGAIVVLVFAGVVLSLPATQQTIRILLTPVTPTPTPRIFFGEDAIVTWHSVPWGELRVDGQLTVLPALTGFRELQPLVLVRGRHTLAYHADPFPPLRCTLSVPAARSDTCPLARPMILPHDLGAVRAVDLGARPDALPDEQRLMLIQVVSTAVLTAAAAPAQTVVPGDHYLGPDGTISIAHSPLQATVTLLVNTDPSRHLQGQPQDCPTLCAEDDLSFLGPPEGWLLQVHVIPRRQFTNTDGHALGPASDTGEDQDALLRLAVRWDGTSWQVINGFAPPLGDACRASFNQLQLPTPPAGGSFSIAQGWVSDGFEGCVESLQLGDAGLQPIGNAAFVLNHFGALLAASDEAHRLFPALPAASAHERALAHQRDAHLPQTSSGVPASSWRPPSWPRALRQVQKLA